MKISPQEYIFYVTPSKELNLELALPEGYYLKIWKPSILRLTPKGLPNFPFIFWSIMNYFHFFSTSEYSILLVYHNNKIINYSVVLPKHFKYPFMESEDIQIGPIWTDVQHRKKGIASYVISEIIEIYKKPGRKFWYVTRKENIPSIQLIEHLHFLKYGTGFKKDRFLGFINYFFIENKY